jgi:hypothetical protein
VKKGDGTRDSTVGGSWHLGTSTNLSRKDKDPSFDMGTTSQANLQMARSRSCLKARICVQGNLQQGDYVAFTPVISWISVHIFLVLSITFKWTTCSIDFFNAFIQATLKEPVWTHLPQGFLSNGTSTCLRMKRSIYGLNYAPRLWWEHILKALKELGLKLSQHDQCLFYMRELMIVLYVDDAGIAVPTIELIDKFINGLKAKGFELTKEGSFSEFLGIKFEEDTSAGSITMTQMRLIKKIITTTKMENCNPNWVPATKEVLGIDPKGKPMEEDWSYPSVIGMLLYLLTNMRPDIAFALSQVACFKHNPKKSHATTIKMIIRYLACTSDKGTIAKPTRSLLIDCYVDADFASLFGRDPDASRSSAKSHLGYVITLHQGDTLRKFKMMYLPAISFLMYSNTQCIKYFLHS